MQSFFYTLCHYSLKCNVFMRRASTAGFFSHIEGTRLAIDTFAFKFFIRFPVIHDSLCELA